MLVLLGICYDRQLTYSLVQSVGMDTETIDILQGSWNTALSKQMHQSMDAFWVVLMEVPKHGVVWHIRLRVSLVASIHGWKFYGITNKEDRKIVKHEILDAILGIKLGCPSSHIADSVTGALLAADG